MRPMSEAPRDGTWILAWHDSFLMLYLVWDVTSAWKCESGWEWNEDELIGWIPCPRTVQEFEAMGRAIATEPITLERLAAAGFVIIDGAACLSRLDRNRGIMISCDTSAPTEVWQGDNTITLRPRDMEDVQRLMAMMEMEVRGE